MAKGRAIGDGKAVERDALVMTAQGPVKFRAATAAVEPNDQGFDFWVVFRDAKGEEAARFAIANVIGWAWPDLAMPAAKPAPAG